MVSGAFLPPTMVFFIFLAGFPPGEAIFSLPPPLLFVSALFFEECRSFGGTLFSGVLAEVFEKLEIFFFAWLLFRH